MIMKKWSKTEYQEFQNRLFEEAEEGYRDFVLTGIITERPLLGVRVPKCRAIAKEILLGKLETYDSTKGKAGFPEKETLSLSKEEQISNALNFLKNTPVAFEEVAIRGYLIASLPYEQMVEEMYKFIPLMDNWEICDTFCAAMKKNISKNKDSFLEEIDKMLKSLDEFQTRVALVCLLDHYIEPEYLQVIYDRINDIAAVLSDGPGELSVERIKGETGGKRVREVMAWDAYYVKMAVAWLISVLFAKFPEETMFFFSHLSMPRWTYNKAILKTCESYRIDKDLKAELKKLKR